ncbi:MAG TPA: glycosyltransferase family 2 protein [Candidatus Dormibacteraeota bacterium]|jgi:glycosyltransferase involved in cell wall biosynthesis|nr:glycosyltransferase family 2 protein [Candidatus Dormibacteraeota bacterium]
MKLAQRLARRSGDRHADAVEVSIVMPCLNEVETLAVCIANARQAIEKGGYPAEIIVADNGSTDGSQLVARELGARVVDVQRKGYGSALIGGIDAAQGRFIVMGDADASYDFAAMAPLIDKLREGYDLVVGNRFLGGIEHGAMPWSHRYFGNPVLTRISSIFFHAPVGDTHCGLRAFTKDAYERMRLRATGMEFASEMVIKAALKGMRITEVPVVLHPDGRSRAPHLRTWRDGWRHLRFMLLFSPRWLFLYPGLALLSGGLVLSALLVVGPLRIGGVRLDIHTLLVAGFVALLGYQLVLFAVFTKLFAIREGFHPPHPMLQTLLRYITLEVGLLTGTLMALGGLVALVLAVASWQSVGFGNLNPSTTMREVIPAVVLLALGTQTIFASFFISILSIERD